ncbi:MAG: amidohydrolase [Saprospiraceae bacterium]
MMRLTIVQSALSWEDPKANRDMFSKKLSVLKNQTDLVVLPEMFSTGFSMDAATLAELMEGPTIKWLLKTAKSLSAAITGSFICKANDHFFNRLVFVFPEGKILFYDKRHLFGMANEHKFFSNGNKKLIVEWKGFHIRPLICYDLRFPVWSRNQKDTPYDLLLYVANWPVTRSHHWNSLLTARAIENQCYVAGVNICGQDGNNLDYSGDSAIIDYSGRHLVKISNEEGLFTTTISREKLDAFRKQLPFLQDADTFSLER